MEQELKRTKELNDKYEKIFEEKYQGKNTHTSPAPETLARLKLLEDNQTKFMDKLDTLEEKIDQTLLKLEGLPKRIFDEADQKYASKDYEKALRWTAIFIGGGVLGYIGSTLIKVIEM
jgi:ABC-type Zn2+ transport system substrate-binding protein/surface adhesin